MFFHGGLLHIGFNMLMLYYMGRILMDFQPNRAFYTIFFGGGILGALFYLGLANLFPAAFVSSHVIGASAGVSAIVIATAVLVPNYELYLFGAFRLRIKWIGYFFVGRDLLYLLTPQPGDMVSHEAHLGGAIFGALYILYSQGRIRFDSLPQIRNPFKTKYTIVDERDILKDREVKTWDTSSRRESKHRHSSGKPRQEEVDAILDKIGQSGYDSLSKEEKELLFRASE